MNATPTDFPALEVKCECCNGEGGTRREDGWIPCYECNGSGEKATEFGKRVLRFVAGHIDASSEIKVRV
jgi:DnaJ-class molecular chaperone